MMDQAVSSFRPTGREAGFSLGMTLIWIAVIGIIILVTTVVNQTMQQNMERSGFSEPVALLAAAKEPLTIVYRSKGVWPVENLEAMFNTSGKYTESLTGEVGPNGAYTLTATLKKGGDRPELHGKTVRMRTTDGGATWQCGPGSIDPQYLPSTCRVSIP